MGNPTSPEAERLTFEQSAQIVSKKEHLECWQEFRKAIRLALKMIDVPDLPVGSNRVGPQPEEVNARLKGRNTQISATLLVLAELFQDDLHALFDARTRFKAENKEEEFSLHKTLAKSVQAIINRLGLGVQCQKGRDGKSDIPCDRPAYLRCSRTQTSLSGIYQYGHGDTNHKGRSEFPLVILVDQDGTPVVSEPTMKSSDDLSGFFPTIDVHSGISTVESFKRKAA